MKSENKSNFNLENILKSSEKNRMYSVMVEKLSTDDINLWTGRVPHWSKIDQYSSLSEVDSDSNNKQHYDHDANRETESIPDTTVVPVGHIRGHRRGRTTAPNLEETLVNQFFTVACAKTSRINQDNTTNPHLGLSHLP